MVAAVGGGGGEAERVGEGERPRAEEGLSSNSESRSEEALAVPPRADARVSPPVGSDVSPCVALVFPYP